MFNVEYRHINENRWTKVEADQIYDHDFLSMMRSIRVHTEDGVKFPKTFTEYKQLMADYSKAEPEAGEVKKDAINPSHYKNLLEISRTDGTHVDTLQWLEHLQYKPFWRNNMRAFVQAVMDMCCDKYLARMGMKDDETQEMEKSMWYHRFALAIMKNGYKPVRVNDVAKILGEADPKELDMLRRYASVTAKGYSDSEWNESIFSRDLTAEEVEKLKNNY